MEEIKNTAHVASRETSRYPVEMSSLLPAAAPPYHSLTTGGKVLASLAYGERAGWCVRSIAYAETTWSNLRSYIAVVDVDRDTIPKDNIPPVGTALRTKQPDTQTASRAAAKGDPPTIRVAWRVQGRHPPRSASRTSRLPVETWSVT